MTAIKNIYRGFLNGDASIRGLVIFRMLFGVLLFILTARFPAYGWIESYFVEPTFLFKYHGFHWVHAWPSWGMYAHFGAMGILSICIAAGLFYRFSMITFTVLFAYVFLLDVTLYLNHYYLVCLVCVLMSFMPAHRAWSLDGLRKPDLRVERVPVLYLNILRFQFVLVYFFGGIAKLNGDWLFSAVPLKIWLAGRTDVFLIGPLLALPVTAYVFSWVGLLFDLSIPFLLWNRRSRPAALVLLVVFHVITRMLFPIGMFPWIMIAGATLFLSHEPEQANPASDIASAPIRMSRPGSFAKALVIAYICVQILIPLRLYLYPGDVRWSEQGFRFAWRVMVMQKSGHAEFLVRHGNGPERRVKPGRHLTPLQVQQMSTQPDLILRFAHFIANRLAEPHGRRPTVRAHVRVSMNGRRNRELIDSRTDLAREHDGFRHKKWITPRRPDRR